MFENETEVARKLNHCSALKGMEHVTNIFMSFDKYLFLEVINILI